MWNKWAEKLPKPGTHVYVKDIEDDEYDIGWAMGKGEDIKVAIANDPTANEFTFDLWQLVSEPIE